MFSVPTWPVASSGLSVEELHKVIPDYQFEAGSSPKSSGHRARSTCGPFHSGSRPSNVSDELDLRPARR